MSCNEEFHDKLKDAAASIGVGGGCAVLVCKCGVCFGGIPVTNCTASDAARLLGTAGIVLNGLIDAAAKLTGADVEDMVAETDQWFRRHAQVFEQQDHSGQKPQGS